MTTIGKVLLTAAAASLIASCGGGGGGSSTPTFSIGGTVSGLAGTGLVLQINGGGNLPVAANGSFTFTTPIVSGATYKVTVLGFPAAPTQACSVANGTGTASANVSNVGVSCTAGYLVGGAVSGVTGTGLVLRDNGGSDRPIAGDGGFTFNAPVAVGGAFNVTVFAPPTGQSCAVASGSGTSTTDVSNVAVSCTLGFSVTTEADPLVFQQWHLKNTAQNAFSDATGTAGVDINVDPVYSAFGYSGVGVIAAVVDTGLEIGHEDLAVNVVPGGSFNFRNGTSDPTNTIDSDGDHGTSVGGLIAMARNSTGGIGVAPAAKLKGFNFLSVPKPQVSQLVASLGGSSANPASNDVSIFNESFGQTRVSDGKIDPTVLAQLISGVNTLRGGKGALYVKAGGNGFLDMGLTSNVNCDRPFGPISAGVSCENVNFDPENATPYQIIVGAIVASGIKASYSTAGSALWVSAPGGGGGFNAAVAGPGFVSEAYQPAMVTADQSGCVKGFARTNSGTSSFDNGAAPNTSCNYTNTMNGTSSATPVTVGVIALLLEANPALTWRDVKHILASTAKQIDPGRAAVAIAVSNGSYVAEPAWTTNNAGFKFHNWYGFGMVDASAAVTLARTYTAGAFGALADTGSLSSGPLNVAIPDNSVTGAGTAINVGNATTFVEAVQISVTATHNFTGDLAIELTSPKGTRSVLKTGDDGFGGAPNLNGMVLVSNAFYGENPQGAWGIKVVDVAPQDVGTLTSWTLRIYGH